MVVGVFGLSLEFGVYVARQQIHRNSCKMYNCETTAILWGELHANHTTKSQQNVIEKVPKPYWEVGPNNWEARYVQTIC